MGANRATTSGDTPVIANGVAIGVNNWPFEGELTACAPRLPAPLTFFTNSANSREFSLKEISENETCRVCPGCPEFPVRRPFPSPSFLSSKTSIVY